MKNNIKYHQAALAFASLLANQTKSFDRELWIKALDLIAKSTINLKAIKESGGYVIRFSEDYANTIIHELEVIPEEDSKGAFIVWLNHKTKNSSKRKAHNDYLRKPLALAFGITAQNQIDDIYLDELYNIIANWALFIELSKLDCNIEL